MHEICLLFAGNKELPSSGQSAALRQIGRRRLREALLTAIRVIDAHDKDLP
jgi:hypothetical protein